MELKQQVKQILEECPESRNSDIVLTIEVWKRVMPHLSYFFDKLLKLLLKLPREDNCKRYRAMYQAKGQYVPTDWEVAKQRRMKEDFWRKSLNYKPFKNYSND